MIKDIVKLITMKIFEIKDYNEIEQEKIKYGLEVILTDLSKIIMLLIIYQFFNVSLDFIVILILSVPVRINIGGFHMKKYYSCFIFSLFYYTLIIIINNFLYIHKLTFITINILCILIVYIISPVLPSQRLGVSSIKCDILKRRSTALVSIYTLMYAILNNPYGNYFGWVVLIQTILILLAKGGIYYEEKNLC